MSTIFLPQIRTGNCNLVPLSSSSILDVSEDVLAIDQDLPLNLNSQVDRGRLNSHLLDKLNAPYTNNVSPAVQRAVVISEIVSNLETAVKNSKEAKAINNYTIAKYKKLLDDVRQLKNNPATDTPAAHETLYSQFVQDWEVGTNLDEKLTYHITALLQDALKIFTDLGLDSAQLEKIEKQIEKAIEKALDFLFQELFKEIKNYIEAIQQYVPEGPYFKNIIIEGPIAV